MPSADSDLVVPYAAADGGGDALRIRTDGTAIARYPGGALAVTVDQSGGRTDRADAPPREGAGFVLTASFRRGGVAVSFDGSGGGSVNRKDGSLWLRHDPVRGGSLHDATGEAVRRWPAPASHGSGRTAMTGDAWVCERLDDHLAVCFCVEDGSFALPFTTGSVKHVLRLGHNAQLAPFWDEETEPFLRSLSKAAAAAAVGAGAGRRSRNTLPRGLENVSISASVASLPVFGDQRRRA